MNNQTTLDINKNRIGAVIGAGGKTIRKIQEQTGARVEINDDGIVNVSGDSPESVQKAINWIKVIAGQIAVGDRFDGVVRRAVEFGLFVELVPGVDGLVHISAIPQEKQQQIAQMYPEGSTLAVEVKNYDPAKGRIGLQIVGN